MKRFWRTAEPKQSSDGWEILLDGRPLRLPGGLALVVPFAALAGAVAEEWQSAAEELGWEALPLTQLAGTAQHRIAPDPAPTVAALAQYARADCLCYRAEHPPALSVRQHHAWQPWLDWAARTHGARLVVTNGINPMPQPADALARLESALAGLNPYQLAALGVLIPAYGSLILGLAVADGALPAAEALDISCVDERFQQESWGLDDAAAARTAHIRAETTQAARFLSLSTP